MTSPTINIYCDESCHLENDRQSVMVLGAVWCPSETSQEIYKRMREIKDEHHLDRSFEIKWTKVSKAKVKFYKDIVDYFFDNSDLHFRALIVPDKSLLKHELFNQDHNTFYYKMYFDMLKTILSPKNKYNIYLDIKDSNSSNKVRMLRQCLSNNMYDFSRNIIQKIQNVRSHEVELVQMADLLIGAISYLNRGLNENSGKTELIQRIQKRSGYTLTRTTLYREDKVNIFRWRGRDVQP